MNPALRPPVFNGQKYIPKGYVLNLPGDVEPHGVPLAKIPSTILKKVQKPSRFYTVQKGDTAGKIARNHRVKLDDLILANNLDRRATVYARQTLRIPQRGQLVQTAKKAQRPRPTVSALRVAAVDRLPRCLLSPRASPWKVLSPDTGDPSRLLPTCWPWFTPNLKTG
jgi:LysM repeat protein